MSERQRAFNAVIQLELMPRFLAKVDVGSSPAGCWMWVGCTDRKGYGSFKVAGQTTMPAHRLSYAALVGPIPAGLQIDHLCREPGCVNPLHLEPVTASENKRRGRNPLADEAKSKTHCHAGHTFDEVNTYLTPNGRRQCRACRREAVRRYDKGRK